MWNDSFGDRGDLEAAKAQIESRREASIIERQRALRREMREQLLGRVCAVLLAGAAFAAVVYFT